MKPSTTTKRRKDRRVRRTQDALLEAMLALIVEKGYDRTTVADILERADIGRATFYSHFYNKEDLLLGRMSLFKLDLSDCLDDQGQARRLPDVTHQFEHVGANHKLYLAMRGSEIFNTALAVARNDLMASFRALFRGRIAPRNPADGDSEFLAQFFTGALLHLIIWWLEQTMPETPRTMNRWFAQLGQNVLTPASRAPS